MGTGDNGWCSAVSEQAGSHCNVWGGLNTVSNYSADPLYSLKTLYSHEQSAGSVQGSELFTVKAWVSVNFQSKKI